MPNTNALWEDMARLNALYEELMWPANDKLTMRIEGDHIVIKNLAQEQRGVPQSFERPQMEMPTPGRQESAAGSFWGDFSSMMDNNPENAWQYLAQAGPGAFQQKLLVQDY